MQVINVLQVSSKQTSAPIFHAYCFFLAVQAILPIYWLPLFTEGEWEYIACASHIIQQIIRFYCLGLVFFFVIFLSAMSCALCSAKNLHIHSWITPQAGTHFRNLLLVQICYISKHSSYKHIKSLPCEP